MQYRNRLLEYETPDVLGSRKASDHRRNAFGARHFQPHMTLLMAGSGVCRDLKEIGEPFRQVMGMLRFDRFEIKINQSFKR